MNKRLGGGAEFQENELRRLFKRAIATDSVSYNMAHVKIRFVEGADFDKANALIEKLYNVKSGCSNAAAGRGPMDPYIEPGALEYFEPIRSLLVDKFKDDFAHYFFLDDKARSDEVIYYPKEAELGADGRANTEAVTAFVATPDGAKKLPAHAQYIDTLYKVEESFQALKVSILSKN